MHKSIKKHHVLLTALVHTRSVATIFNVNAYNKLGSLALKKLVVSSLRLENQN